MNRQLQAQHIFSLLVLALLAISCGEQVRQPDLPKQSSIVNRPETVDCDTWKANWIKANAQPAELYMEEKWITNKTQITTRINGLILPRNSPIERIREEAIAAIKRADPFDEAFFDLEYTEDIKTHEAELKAALREIVVECGLDPDAVLPKPRSGPPE